MACDTWSPVISVLIVQWCWKKEVRVCVCACVRVRVCVHVCVLECPWVCECPGVARVTLGGHGCAEATRLLEQHFFGFNTFFFQKNVTRAHEFTLHFFEKTVFFSRIGCLRQIVEAGKSM